MEIDELENLVSQNRQLNLTGHELRSWVEGERPKLRAQREAERAALKAAKQKEIAELKVQLAQLERQRVECSAQESFTTIFNSGIHCEENGKGSVKCMVMPVHLEPKGVFAEIEPQEDEVAYYVGTLSYEPYISLSNEEPLLQ